MALKNEVKNEVSYVKAADADIDQRLDNYLIKKLKGIPRSHIYRIIRSGEVRINKKRVKAHTKLSLGDEIRLPPMTLTMVKPVTLHQNVKEGLESRIIFENASLLVLNKPSGMAVHGGSGVSLGVIEALRLARDKHDYFELVHRLDRETSGCLLIAKKRSFLRAIHELLSSNQVEKTYWALLSGSWKRNSPYLADSSLKKYQLYSGERKVVIDSLGKAATTEFHLIKNFKEACLVTAKPKTGRTHQIRVHAASLGHPLLGDEKYGSDSSLLLTKTLKCKRLCLHALEIAFDLMDVHHHYQAELPAELTALLKRFDNYPI